MTPPCPATTAPRQRGDGAGAGVDAPGTAASRPYESWLTRKCAERMAALGKLLRTTAFQLTLVYLIVFALFAAFLVGYFALNTRRLINEQIVGTVDIEVMALTGQYNQAGIRRLVVIVDVRSPRPGSSLYLVTTPTG